MYHRVCTRHLAVYHRDCTRHLAVYHRDCTGHLAVYHRDCTRHLVAYHRVCKGHLVAYHRVCTIHLVAYHRDQQRGPCWLVSCKAERLGGSTAPCRPSASTAQLIAWAMLGPAVFLHSPEPSKNKKQNSGGWGGGGGGAQRSTDTWPTPGRKPPVCHVAHTTRVAETDGDPSHNPVATSVALRVAMSASRH